MLSTRSVTAQVRRNLFAAGLHRELPLYGDELRRSLAIVPICSLLRVICFSLWQKETNNPNGLVRNQ